MSERPTFEPLAPEVAPDALERQLLDTWTSEGLLEIPRSEQVQSEYLRSEYPRSEYPRSEYLRSEYLRSEYPRSELTCAALGA